MGTGEAWKRERESRGMTLDEATAVIHISRKYIIGIEEGDFTGWPERVFSSGYIRAYAKLISQDPEPVLTEYYSQLEKQAVKPTEPATETGWVERERRKGGRKTVFVLAVAVVLLLGLALAWYGRRTAPPPVPAPEVKPVQPPAAAPAPMENAATAAPVGVSDNARAAGEQASPAAGTASPVSASAPSGATPGTVASVGGVGPVKSPYQLFLEAAELTWMMYTLDDGQSIEVTLYPGDKISIQARKTILLKLGNAGGIAGTLNGKPLPSFGDKGQVKEIRIGE